MKKGIHIIIVAILGGMLLTGVAFSKATKTKTRSIQPINTPQRVKCKNRDVCSAMLLDVGFAIDIKTLLNTIKADENNFKIISEDNSLAYKDNLGQTVTFFDKGRVVVKSPYNIVSFDDVRNLEASIRQALIFLGAINGNFDKQKQYNAFHGNLHFFNAIPFNYQRAYVDLQKLQATQARLIIGCNSCKIINAQAVVQIYAITNSMLHLSFNRFTFDGQVISSRFDRQLDVGSNIITFPIKKLQSGGSHAWQVEGFYLGCPISCVVENKRYLEFEVILSGQTSPDEYTTVVINGSAGKSVYTEDVANLDTILNTTP